MGNNTRKKAKQATSHATHFCLIHRSLNSLIERLICIRYIVFCALHASVKVVDNAGFPLNKVALLDVHARICR